MRLTHLQPPVIMHIARIIALAALALAAAAHGAAAQTAKGVNEFGNPSRITPRPTSATITPKDLQTRLYQFADDSMQGRQIGRIGNMKGTDMIAREVRRLGLLPAGDDGTYFQVLPYHLKSYTTHSRLTANGSPLAWGNEWIAIPGARIPRAITSVDVIFGGVAGDTTKQITAAQAAGKFVVLLSAAPQTAPPTGGRGGGFGGFAVNRFADAAAVATVDLDTVPANKRLALTSSNVATASAAGRGGGAGRGGAAPVDSIILLKQQIAALSPQATIRITRDAAARLFTRKSIDGLSPGNAGATVNASLDFVELPSNYARNVIAIIPGSDPVLRNEYVAIGAHNDHVGMTATAVDKDSLKAFNNARNKMLLANNMLTLTPAQTATIKVNMDSIRRVIPKPRLDSINNGADDDGSGSMGVLEIAEAIQAMKVKPKRTTLFVWHTGEEAGLVGSNFFTRNPTVPMDSVVAQINIDMIGRGRAEDLPGGGPNYVGIVGSMFDSRDLGEMAREVNRKQPTPLELDNKYDTTLTWSGYNNIYGRSDHFNYAQQGVPIAFFFTGLHGDYHQRTDEAEFIDYPHYARITNYIRDLVVEVADGPRPRMNGTKPARPPRAVVP